MSNETHRGIRAAQAGLFITARLAVAKFVAGVVGDVYALVIGGILSATALTLVVLPVLYRLFHREADAEPAPQPEAA